MPAANWNARALGARHLEFSPGMAIGWYFVPFLNLIKPYQAMKEIYQASTGAERWQGQPVSVLLGPWWALWLASSFAGNASFRLALKAEEVDALMTANRVTLVADLLSLPLCLVFLALMARIHAMQMRRHAAGAADHAAAPGDPLPAGQESAVAIEAGADPASNPASDIRD